MRYKTRSATVLGGIVLAAVAVGAAFFDGESTAQVVVEQSPVQAAPAPPRPLPPAAGVDVPGLMRLFNKPLYVSLKETMVQQPADQKGWDDLRARGLQSAEIANLIALRPVEPQRAAWVQGAAEMQRAGIAFADAAKARQWDAARQAYAGLVQSCNNCHKARAPDKAPQLKP
jgi:hypothetical protein